MVWTRLFNPEATTDQYEAPAIILLGFLGVYTEVWSMQYDVLYSYPLYSLLLSSVFSTLHLPSVLSTRILCTPILPSSVFSIPTLCTQYSYHLYSQLYSYHMYSLLVSSVLLYSHHLYSPFISSVLATPILCILYSYPLYALFLSPVLYSYPLHSLLLPSVLSTPINYIPYCSSLVVHSYSVISLLLVV